ncbi:MAG: hypothetical protein WD187_02840 [Candidatus Woykebacteria bacterium]
MNERWGGNATTHLTGGSAMLVLIQRLVAVSVLILTLVVLVVLIRDANERVSPNGPPAAEQSMDGWYYPRHGDTLEGIAILFYGQARYKSFLLNVNQERGILENSGLPPEVSIFIPGAIQNWEFLSSPAETRH